MMRLESILESMGYPIDLKWKSTLYRGWRLAFRKDDAVATNLRTKEQITGATTRDCVGQIDARYQRPRKRRNQDN